MHAVQIIMLRNSSSLDMTAAAHMEGEVLDGVLPAELRQLCPLGTMQLGNLDCARNVLECRLWHERSDHDFAQLKVTLAMSGVQRFAANESGNRVWPLP